MAMPCMLLRLKAREINFKNLEARLSLHMQPMLYAWPSWKTDSPDGLSLVSSRAFYTAEPKQQLQEDSNWAALTDAKRQATRLRLNNNPEAYVDLCGRGLPGHHRNAFPPVSAPYGCMRVGTVPPAVQQLRAAQVT